MNQCKTNLLERAKACLDSRDPDEKVALSRSVAADWRAGRLDVIDAGEVQAIDEPGRPVRPRLVAARDLPRRSPNTAAGRATLVHALAHIEFNAINLAWDAVYRFRGMPREYYGDWLRVADEEAYHFTLLRDRLRELGHEYGDFDAHDGLWEMARKTAHDPLVRMALVPRVLEARGLDVTPGMMERLRTAGDDRTADILIIILRDEVGHVEIGSRWFAYLCEQRGLAPEPTYRALLSQYMKGRIKKPFYREARLKAGFTEAELDYLEGFAESV